MKSKIFLIFGMFAVVITSGCILSEEEFDITGNPTAKCIELCEAEKAEGTFFENGPCLSDDNPSWQFNDWVCDVAHDPREAVDNLEANQCQAYRNGSASQFVEVDENCEMIRRSLI